MNDRFAVLEKSKITTYNKELPVLVLAANLLQDTVSGRLFAMTKLQSISAKQLVSVGIRIESLDAQERTIETVDFDYDNLHLYRDNTVGEGILIPLEDNRGRKLIVRVISAVDSSGMEMHSDNRKISTLWTSGPLDQHLGGNRELAKQYQLRYGQAHEYAPAKSDGLWSCSCGAVNLDNEDICHKCGTRKENVLDPDLDSLKSEMMHRLAAEKAERDRNHQKATRIGIIAGVVIAAIVIIALVMSKMIIPEIHYREAVDSYKAGHYESAYSTFVSLKNYKKSKKYAKLSQAAFCEEQYKDILLGRSGGELLDYFTTEDIKSTDTQFALACIDSDSIPELIVSKEGECYIYTFDGEDYLDYPRMCNSITLYNASETGYYEKTGYIQQTDNEDGYATVHVMPLDELAYMNSYYVETYDDPFSGVVTDYYVIDGEGYEEMVSEDDYKSRLKADVGGGEYKELKFYENNDKNRENRIKVQLTEAA